MNDLRKPSLSLTYSHRTVSWSVWIARHCYHSWRRGLHIVSRTNTNTVDSKLDKRQGDDITTVHLFPGETSGLIAAVSDISCHVCDDQNKYFNPKYDLLRTLTECFLCLNQPRAEADCGHKMKLSTNEMLSCRIKKSFNRVELLIPSMSLEYDAFKSLLGLFLSLCHTHTHFYQSTVCCRSGPPGARRQLTVPVSSDYMSARHCSWTDNIVTQHHTNHDQIIWAAQLQSDLRL